MSRSPRYGIDRSALLVREAVAGAREAQLTVELESELDRLDAEVKKAKAELRNSDHARLRCAIASRLESLQQIQQEQSRLELNEPRLREDLKRVDALLEKASSNLTKQEATNGRLGEALHRKKGTLRRDHTEALRSEMAAVAAAATSLAKNGHGELARVLVDHAHICDMRNTTFGTMPVYNAGGGIEYVTNRAVRCPNCNQESFMLIESNEHGDYSGQCRRCKTWIWLGEGIYPIERVSFTILGSVSRAVV